MFKKKKIRMDFDEVFKTGDEAQIKQMLAEHPWLLEEWQARMDNTMTKQQEVVAALGVMEDELVGPVPIDEISYCLRVDFKMTKAEEEIVAALQEAQNLGYCKQKGTGWILTLEGGKICDNFLNTHVTELEQAI